MADLAITEIRAAIKILDELAQGEYGLSLEALLVDGSDLSALRLERITAVALKRPFATVSPGNSYSLTQARRSWPWTIQSIQDLKPKHPKEFALLDELRKPGPWNRLSPASSAAEDSVSWEQFKMEVEYERGLFKVLALYVVDKLQGNGARSIAEYLEASESRRFESGLDIAVLVSDAAILAPLAGLTGIPEVAIGLALIGIQFGYRRLTEERPDVSDQGG